MPPPLGSSPSGGGGVLQGGGGGNSTELLGTSPGMSQLNALSTQGDSYTYQAADGQWVFLNRYGHAVSRQLVLHRRAKEHSLRSKSERHTHCMSAFPPTAICFACTACPEPTCSRPLTSVHSCARTTSSHPHAAPDFWSVRRPVQAALPIDSVATAPPPLYHKPLPLLRNSWPHRARPHFLSHLPLSGAFCLVELALPPAGLPPEALASFADELAAREKR